MWIAFGTLEKREINGREGAGKELRLGTGTESLLMEKNGAGKGLELDTPLGRKLLEEKRLARD